jgi:hypothetical protein
MFDLALFDGAVAWTKSSLLDTIGGLYGQSFASIISLHRTAFPKPSVANNTQHNAGAQSLSCLYIYLRDLYFRSAPLTTTYTHNGPPFEGNSVRKGVIQLPFLA